MDLKWSDIKSDPNLLVKVIRQKNYLSKEAIVSMLNANQFAAFNNLAKTLYRNNTIFETNTPEIVREAFHDAILKIIEHIEINKLQTITVSLSTLVNKYCLLQLKSKLTDIIRRKNHLRVVTINEEMEIPIPSSDHKVIEKKSEIFIKYFKQLGERCRELIRFRKLSQLNTEEIAEKMNLSVLSVNSEASKCFSKLKELIYNSNEFKTLYHG